MILPSKELMGEVLLNIEKEEICTYELCWGRDIRYSIRFKDKNNDGTFNYEDDEINIYEFAHKHCIDWAFNKGYDICPKEVDGKYYLLTDEKILGNKIGNHFVVSDSFPSFDNRIEAIFKACEWIMEQTKCGS